MIVYPAWASFAGLTAIVMDLRLSPLSGNGPIIAAFVTRPTKLAELRREAGIYAVRTCNVFASSSPDALEDDELIYVDFRNPPEIRVGAVNKPKTCAALAFVSRSCFSRVRLDTRSF